MHQSRNISVTRDLSHMRVNSAGVSYQLDLQNMLESPKRSFLTADDRKALSRRADIIDEALYEPEALHETFDPL